MFVSNGGSPILAAIFLLSTGPIAVATSLAHGVAVGNGLLWIVNVNRAAIAGVRTISLVAAFVVGALTLEVALAIFALAQIAGLSMMLLGLRRFAFPGTHEIGAP